MVLYAITTGRKYGTSFDIPPIITFTGEDSFAVYVQTIMSMMVQICFVGV